CDNLKNKVTPDQYQQLLTFMHLPSKTAIDDFTQWVEGLGNRRVKAWWDHKRQLFILSGIVQCCSAMTSESWTITNSTTNMNEAQHAWTNKFTGTKLSLLEAILMAQKLDFDTLKDVQVSLQSGILRNNRSTFFERTSHNVIRRANKANKQKAKQAHNDTVSDLRRRVAEAEANTKKLKGALREANGNKPRVRKHAAESSSSGQVAVVQQSRSQARIAANPYPVHHEATTSLLLERNSPDSIPQSLGIQALNTASSSALSHSTSSPYSVFTDAPLISTSDNDSLHFL
ncbi:hypothetical protein EV361DRAFT_874092, partial [Lentinula raphanica]